MSHLHMQLAEPLLPHDETSSSASGADRLGINIGSVGVSAPVARSIPRTPHSLGSSSPHSYEPLSMVARAAAAAAASSAAVPSGLSPPCSPSLRPESPLYGAASDLSLLMPRPHNYSSKGNGGGGTSSSASGQPRSPGPPFRTLHSLSVAVAPSSFSPGPDGQEDAASPWGGDSCPPSGATTPGSARSFTGPFSLNPGGAGGGMGGAGASHGPTQDWTLFSLGVRLGALLLLAFWVLWDCIVDSKLRPSESVFWLDAVLPVYRCTGFLILAYWLWGVLVYVWSRYKINYMFLLGLQPRASNTPREVFAAATRISLIFLANFLIYFKMERGDFPRFLPDGVMPAGMFVLLVLVMAPWPCASRGQRDGGCGTPIKQWPRAFAQVLVAPFGPVRFIHVIIGDVLTSLVKPLIDVAYSCCFVFSGLFLQRHLTEENGRVCLDSFVLNKVLTPIISALPLYLRLMQCFRRYYDTQQRFPHLINSGKYATGLSVVLIGVFHQSFTRGSHGEHAAWIAALATSTLYSYSWDVLMDWDLGKRQSGGLRPQLIYGARWKYYAAIVLDLFFRFAWALTFVPAGEQSPLGKWWTKGLNPLVAGMEMARRAGWALFRVENEHLVQLVNAKPDDVEEELAPQGPDSVGVGTGTGAVPLLVGARKQSRDELDHDPESRLGAEHSLRNQARARAEARRRNFTTGLKLLVEIAALAAVVTGAALISYFTA